MLTIYRLKSGRDRYFEEFYKIYTDSIAERERKIKADMVETVSKDNYRTFLLFDNADLVGFSVSYISKNKNFALLEYMAVDRLKRSAGFGVHMFNETIRLLSEESKNILVILEVDSAAEVCADREIRLRRQNFYKRLGCKMISHLEYILPLPGEGEPPKMDLLVKFSGPEYDLTRSDLKSFLEEIYTEIYSMRKDDLRINTMLEKIQSPINLI